MQTRKLGCFTNVEVGQNGLAFSTTEKLPEKEISPEILRQQGVNFTNILPADFTHADPKSAKKLLTDNLTVFFVLYESALVKGAGRMLVISQPELL